MAAKDTKDVKLPAPTAQTKPSSASVLPRSVPRAATSSKSRSHKRVVIEDYVSVDDTSATDTSDDEKARLDTVVRSNNPTSRQKAVVKSAQDSVLPQMALTDAELEQFLLREIAARSGGRHEGTLAESKHLYGAAGALFTASGTEVASASSAVAGGTTVSTRLTNTICLRRLRIKLLLTRSYTGAGNTIGAQMPMVHMVIFRDKTPATPGTAPTVHGTDAAPPASISLLFSRLGANQGFDTDRTMILNPITEDLYHIYTYKKFGWSYEGTNLSGTAPAQEWDHPSKCQIHEENLDLNEVKQIYAGSAATPVTNAIYVVIWSDYVDDNALGFQQGWRLVSDCEFHDVQDD